METTGQTPQGGNYEVEMTEDSISSLIISHNQAKIQQDTTEGCHKDKFLVYLKPQTRQDTTKI